MKINKLYRAAQITLWSLLVVGLLVWSFTRFRDTGSATTIYGDMELMGRAFQAQSETFDLAQRVASRLPKAGRDDLVKFRAQAELLEMSVKRLREKAGSAKSAYIPVDQAAALLDSCARVAQLIEREMDGLLSPGSKSGKDALQRDPAERARLIVRAASPLEEQLRVLRELARPNITHGILAQESVLGVSPLSFLAGALVMSTLIGVATLIHAVRRQRTPVAVLERTELELLGETDRRAALRRCHERAGEMLELAGRFSRSGKIA